MLFCAITKYPSRLYEVTGSTSTKRVYAGGELVATILGTGTSTASTTYVHADHLGSTRVTNDADGQTVEELDYASFGEVTEDTLTGSGEHRQYIGEAYDVESELSYLNARYYEGSRGQFLSQDPVFLDIGSSDFERNYQRKLQQHLMNPQALNSYSYGYNNPITLKDPEGEIIPLLAIAAGAWAVAELGLSAYDIYSTANTIADPNASWGEKLTSGGLTIAGFALPGGGYGIAGKEALQAYKQTNVTGRALMEGVGNQKVLNLIRDNYKISAKVGTGSTADAVRRELANIGEKVGGKLHSTKAQENLNRINNLFNSIGSGLNSQERNVLNRISNDLKDALRTKSQ